MTNKERVIQRRTDRAVARMKPQTPTQLKTKYSKKELEDFRITCVHCGNTIYFSNILDRLSQELQNKGKSSQIQEELEFLDKLRGDDTSFFYKKLHIRAKEIINLFNRDIDDRIETLKAQLNSPQGCSGGQTISDNVGSSRNSINGKVLATSETSAYGLQATSERSDYKTGSNMETTGDVRLKGSKVVSLLKSGTPRSSKNSEDTNIEKPKQEKTE